MIATGTPKTKYLAGLKDEFRFLVRSSRAPRLRTMRQFAEQEIIIPDGRYKGLRYRSSTQPALSHWFDGIDSGLYRIHALTAPSQAGKSLGGFVVPCMYHLFEIQETVLLGCPDENTAIDKWTLDIRPALQASRFRDQLPNAGSGSKGGWSETITFRNGQTLRFMTGGGGDKSRAAFTTRVLIVTEVDGLDVVGETSQEGTKLDQLIARTASYDDDAVIYLECTVTKPSGAIWQYITKGTNSRIGLPCPHCGDHVTPERMHLHGWQDGKDEESAAAATRILCPACASPWTEEERKAANAASVLLHEGQSMMDGQIVGERKKTRTFGMRFTAANNLFTKLPSLGAREFATARAVDEEAANKATDQFVWATPFKADEDEINAVTVEHIMRRMGPNTRGVLPSGLRGITVGIDIGLYLIHWTAKAYDGTPFAFTVDYGVQEVHSRELPEDTAIELALRQLADEFETMWSRGDSYLKPDLGLCDSGYKPDVVYKVCGDYDWLRPSLGLGWQSRANYVYKRPKATGTIVKEIGTGWHIVQLEERPTKTVEVDANHWKTAVHSRLACAPESPGSILLFRSPDDRTHFAYGKHCTAEKKLETFEPDVGMVTTWERLRKNNHWFDTEALANCAADVYGIASGEEPKVEKPVVAETRFPTRDGKPFFIIR